MHSAIVPNPGRSLYGPVCPNPEYRTNISSGFAASNSSGPTPQFSIVPGRNPSIKISASFASLFKILWPFGLDKSRVIDFLFLECTFHHKETYL